MPARVVRLHASSKQTDLEVQTTGERRSPEQVWTTIETTTIAFLFVFPTGAAQNADNAAVLMSQP